MPVNVCERLFLKAPTWGDNSGHGHTFQMALCGEDADVVLNPQIKVLEDERGLIGSGHLLQGVSSLAVGRRARHPVACEACKVGGYGTNKQGDRT